MFENDKGDWSASSAALNTNAVIRTAGSKGTDFMAATPRGKNNNSEVINPGENLPRAKTKGSTCMNAPLISIRAGNPSATAPYGSDGNSDRSDHNDKTIGDIEVVPPCGQVQHLLSPVPPIEYKLFDYVKTICGYARTEQSLRVSRDSRRMGNRHVRVVFEFATKADEESSAAEARPI
jgi:hypothetical protein